MTEPRPNARLDGIAEVAARLFLDKGYDAASMADLAAATGLGKSSLYHHLSSKDELLAHICGPPLAAMADVVGKATAMPEPAGVRLAISLEGITRIALEDIPACHLILSVKPTSDTARRIVDERRRVERSVADLVVAAQAEGAARTDVEAPLLTRLVVGTLSGLVMWYPDETAEEELGRLRAAVLALMLSAIRAPG
jgi:AcrR family transcriptional regulator